MVASELLGMDNASTFLAVHRPRFVRRAARNDVVGIRGEREKKKIMKVQCPKCEKSIEYEWSQMGGSFVCECGECFTLPLNPDFIENALKAELDGICQQMDFSIEDCFAKGTFPYKEVNAMIRLNNLGHRPAYAREVHKRLKAMPLFKCFGTKIYTDEYLPGWQSHFQLKFNAPVKLPLDEKYTEIYPKR